MGTTQKEISEWFDRGLAQGATRMIVVCDTFGNEDYPSYVMPDQDVRNVAENQYGFPNMKNMQRVMEVYDLRKDKATQLNEHRAFNW
jgi:hypothetical protein